MFKKMLVVLLVLAVIATVSGCQSADALRNDLVGSLNYIGEKVLKPMANKSAARDAKITAKQQSEYHTKQAAVYARYDHVKSGH
jgi:hypothetical protein